MTIKDLVVKNLHEQRSSGSFCDMRLFVGKKHTWAHSAVLCPLSALLTSYYNSPKHNKIGLPRKQSLRTSMKIKLGGKVDSDCFECLEKLIDFIYGRTANITENHTSHILSYCQFLNLSKNLLNLINNTIDILKIEDNFDENNVVIKSEPADNLGENIKISDILCNISFKTNDDDLDAMEYDESEKEDIDKTFIKSDEKNDNNHLSLSAQSESDQMEYDESDKEDVDEPFIKSECKDENNHLRLPTGKTQNCIGCNFKCYKSLDLLSHLRQTGHGGNVCSLCWTESDNAKDLKEHFALHEHPKPFFCTYCDLRFQTRSLLGQHLPRHMFEKPFVCPHCQKAFKRKHGLNCHLVTHSNDKKHLCDECGFSTTHARILRAHKLSHSGDLFKCSFPECTHTSTRKENMKQHLATHSNEKPFVCELCGHKFTQSKSLRRHSLIHSKDELDNICPHCPFKARRIDNLKAHILRQHTDKSPKVEIMMERDTKNIIDPQNNIQSSDRKKRK